MEVKLWFKNLFNPPFTTEDFENSKMQSGIEFSFTAMHFEDGESSHPTRVVGYINDQYNGITKTTWNRYGENTTSGKRVKAFDLFRPSRREIESSEAFLFGFIGILVIVIILLCE